MVVMPKQNVPALRLEGFSGEWELKAIGELFAERNESFPEGELLSVTLRNGIKRFQEIGRHNTSNEDKSKYKLVEVGDIAYNSMRMWQGASGVSPWKGIVSPAYTVLKPVGSQDTPFFAYYFKTAFMIQVFQLNSQGLTSDTWNLKYPALSAIDICRPQDIEEQQAIGAIFTNLDAAINQHMLKHKALQQAKTALMQRMFPQEGQTVPELRLEGFSGEWEEKRLVDEVSFFSGLTYTPSDVVEHDGTLVLRSSNVQDGVIATKDCVYVRTDAVNVQNVRKNDIIMVVRNGSRSLIGKHAVVQKPMPSTVIGAFMTGIRSDQPWFINALFDTGLFKYEVDKSMGATINQITGGMFAGMSFFFPPTLEEQQAIGAIFTKLDALIAAEAQYIKSLSQAKTALLQRMFI